MKYLKDLKRDILCMLARRRFNRLHPEWKGADPCGEYDSTFAINRVISNLIEQGGGRCIIPRGNYYMTGPIRIVGKGDISIDGSGCLFDYREGGTSFEID